jgi:intein/homing endonuclease
VAVKDKIKTGALANLIRDVGKKAKDEAVLVSAGEASGGIERRPIFDVLTFITSSWGLNLRLYPAQRFIVKLYYGLELDNTIADIVIHDMFHEREIGRFTELEYLRYLHREGRCNLSEEDVAKDKAEGRVRRQLILSVGRRAGKCVVGDTLVLTGKGLFPIKELGAAPEDNFAPATIEVAQAAGRRATSTHFYDGGVKPTFRVRTDAAYEVCGTGNHRVLALDETGSVQWKYLSDIRPGDFLALNRSTDLWAQEYVDLKPYHRTDGRKEIVYPDVLDENWGNLLGYLVGDGTWVNDRGVSVTVEHPETREYLRALFTKLFGGYREQHQKATKHTYRLEFCGIAPRRFLHDLGWKLGCGRYEKRVPWVILRSPKTVVCAFLRGLFETDGCAEGGGRVITFSSASFGLAADVQTLLLNLGIVSKVSRKWNPKTERHYANLILKGVRSRQRFAEFVSFDSKKKRLPLLDALSRAQEGKSDTESVPGQFNRIKALLESVPKREMGRGWGRSNVRQAIGNACKPGSGEDLTYSRMKAAVASAKEMKGGVAEIAHFEKLLADDFFFDPVVSVEQGEEHVYDLTVPDGEAFTANGFVNHNSTLSAIFAAYELYRLLSLGNPQAYFGLPDGNRIQLMTIATGKPQAAILYGDISTHLNKCEYFKPFIMSNTIEKFDLCTPADIEKFGQIKRHEDGGRFQTTNGRSSLRVTFKPALAPALRGFGNIIIIMDEMAHFQGEGRSSAKDIYDAVIPSALAFSPKDPKDPMVPIGPVESRIICISSPLNKAGKFYELFHFAMNKGPGSENIIAIQAPTWEINPTVEPTFLREKFHEDPRVFITEFGAEFSDRVRGWIEREQDLVACVDPLRRPKTFGPPRYPHQMGLDVGLVGDGTGVAITHAEGDQIILDYHELWQAGVDWRVSNPHLDAPLVDYARTLGTAARLDFEQIADWIYALSRRFYITDGLFDRWNGIPLEQLFVKRGLNQFKSEFFTRDLRSRIFQAAKLLMFDQKVVLYDWPLDAAHGSKHSPLIEEMLSLQAEQISHNQVLVQAPQIQGAHDDMSDALVRAIWLTLQRLQNTPHMPRGTNPMGPAAGPITSRQYQMGRMRTHGAFSERMAPRGGRNPLLRGR